VILYHHKYTVHIKIIEESLKTKKDSSKLIGSVNKIENQNKIKENKLECHKKQTSQQKICFQEKEDLV